MRKKSLKGLDMFAESPTLQFTASNPKLESKVGIFCTFLVVGIMMWYSSSEINIMLKNTRTTYISSNYAMDLESLGDIKVNEYHNSFMFVFSIQPPSGEDFDIMDNKYVTL